MRRPGYVGPMSSENRYDRRNVDNMEMLYGRGFLSGGGADEVALILDGIDLRSADVLDLGCGLGGATVAMLTRLGAQHVTGFDVDPGNLERAEELVTEAGVQSRATLVEGAPGPLPFEADSFDCVYVNAVSCHVDALAEFFTEIRRVLRPGGVLVGSEWLVRAHSAAFQGWDDLLRERGLSFHFVGSAPFVAAIEAGGLTDVALVDRTDAFTEFSRTSLDHTDTALRSPLVDSLGEEGFEAFRRWCEVRYVALRDGGLLQCHFRATKPVTGAAAAR